MPNHRRLFRKSLPTSASRVGRNLVRVLDPRAIRLMEGARAGLAAAVPVFFAWFTGHPEFTFAALAALLTCLCDPAGPIEKRLPVLLSFIAASTVIMLVLPGVRQFGMPATLAVAVPVLFALASLRIYGAAAQVLGDLLSVVLLLAADSAKTLPVAAEGAAIFAAGGGFALVVTLLIWRIRPHAPQRRAVADVFAALADYAADLAALADPHSRRPARSWNGRAQVRGTIEDARVLLAGSATGSGDTSLQTVRNLMRLQAADQVFGAMIALSDVLENPGPVTRAAAAKSLRRLRPLLRIIAAAVERENLARIPRIERAIALAMADATACQVLTPIAHAIGQRLLVAVATADPAQNAGGFATGGVTLPLRERVAGPLRANFTWRSATLRHAVRIAVVVGGGMLATNFARIPYGHWFTITLVLVMQPYFAHTWGRSIARIMGTLAGGVIAASISLVAQTHLHMAGALPVLGALALSVRRVNYAIYVAVYTPVVILLTEQLHASSNPFAVARERAALTVLAGFTAIAANAVLWPAWEPNQAEVDLIRAIAAHAAFARAVLGGAGGADAARREAGLATNNLEASIERALHEPRRGQAARLLNLRAADATLRRIGGRLVAWSLDPALIDSAQNCAQAVWVQAALTDLADARTPTARPVGAAAHETLARMARQVELLAGTLLREHAA